MGAKQSTTNSPRVRAFSNAGMSSSTHGSSGTTGSSSGGLSLLRPGALTPGPDARQRARSFSNVPNGHSTQPISVPSSSIGAYGRSATPDSNASSTPEETPLGRLFGAHSLPAQLWSFNGIKCPVCNKFVLPDDVECHLVMCLTKPRINYNDDVLTEDKGECVICLEELRQGDTIARLPCLCVYHKGCIDRWFDVNRSCPEHPSD